jgi:hypothetical protein
MRGAVGQGLARIQRDPPTEKRRERLWVSCSATIPRLAPKNGANLGHSSLGLFVFVGTQWRPCGTHGVFFCSPRTYVRGYFLSPLRG